MFREVNSEPHAISVRKPEDYDFVYDYKITYVNLKKYAKDQVIRKINVRKTKFLSLNLLIAFSFKIDDKVVDKVTQVLIFR